MLNFEIESIIQDLSNFLSNDISTSDYKETERLLKDIFIDIDEKPDDLIIFNNIKKKFLTFLSENIKDRFPCITIIKNFKIFNSKEFSKLTDPLLEHYGENELLEILKYFNQPKYTENDAKIHLLSINSEETLREWKIARRIIFKQYKSLDTISAWRNLFLDTSGLLPICID